jgi:hypothetical protein
VKIRVLKVCLNPPRANRIRQNPREALHLGCGVGRIGEAGEFDDGLKSGHGYVRRDRNRSLGQAAPWYVLDQFVAAMTLDWEEKFDTALRNAAETQSSWDTTKGWRFGIC